jgi:D-glycero-alpha-D-manno-heptose-7-phosphate kinase
MARSISDVGSLMDPARSDKLTRVRIDVTEHTSRPLAVVNSVAPIRICDNGCWTDTWFAGHGQVFNVAVYPYAEVQVAIHPARDGAARLVIHPENFGEGYEVRHDAPPWGPHPLLEAAIAYMKVPRATCGSR